MLTSQVVHEPCIRGVLSQELARATLQVDDVRFVPSAGDHKPALPRSLNRTLPSPLEVGLRPELSRKTQSLYSESPLVTGAIT